MNINLVKFNTDIGKTKPENLVHAEAACPFCDVEHLTDIIETDGDIIFLRNKYNVIESADQFVLIEGANAKSTCPIIRKKKCAASLKRAFVTGKIFWRRASTRKFCSSRITAS